MQVTDPFAFDVDSRKRDALEHRFHDNQATHGTHTSHGPAASLHCPRALHPSAAHNQRAASSSAHASTHLWKGVGVHGPQGPGGRQVRKQGGEVEIRDQVPRIWP